ncbi:multisubunit sodium/proton antiporter, MrpD subunit (TC 2.A.63.1) [Desulfonatronum thiosulfatophilum]|uniref:Multisubunit sodium/proton antiporter, MrpD subunit (TC 2.A.63.1) n=1 Tax=Desulfonatronum thiosulfatophilum TaxID=617002 RepID=A0A1G6ENF6_9BACT|nr:Na(+)/H(+) antiporter subunit D [Desulfonatronum thiosulfatophilum]SDB58904.1 multisubunit sodium/proton antiporter, MrpD subunit (TC 2.A.63.1) [Desulfonatronum thiosulfatophilum]
MPIELPPVLVMWLGLVLLPLLPKNIRPAAFLAFPLAALILVLTIPLGTVVTMPFATYELVVLEVTQISRVFGIIFALIAFLCGVYALHMRDTGQQAAALLYSGGALGVTFCGDFFTLLVCWEVMAAGSTYLIWARRSDAAQRAGMRYLLYHLLGGSFLLAGIVIHAQTTGSLLLTTFTPGESFASWLILIGVLINAAAVPLHAWLPDSYPKATITGTVILSAFTTKTAVYVLAILFPGWPLLIYIGVAMALYGVSYAFLANDIREILSYHIISQVGFMVAAVGIGTELAINGAAAFAFSNILYKSLMFMGAGAVLYATGTSKLSELGALASRMRWVLIFYMVGALSISGAPLFMGFVTKTIIITSAGESYYYVAKFLLILASVGTFLSVGIKLPYYTWYHEEKVHHKELKPVPTGMIAAMAATSLLCIVYGIFPGLLYQELPYDMIFKPFTFPLLVESTQILIFTFLGFWYVRHKMTPKDYISLDVDWFYRKAAPYFRRVFVGWVNAFFDASERMGFRFADYVSYLSSDPVQVLRKFRAPSRDFDADVDRPPLSTPIMVTLLLTVLVAAWSLW